MSDYELFKPLAFQLDSHFYTIPVVNILEPRLLNRYVDESKQICDVNGLYKDDGTIERTVLGQNFLVNYYQVYNMDRN